jgi:hypothetical protein
LALSHGLERDHAEAGRIFLREIAKVQDG